MGELHRVEAGVVRVNKGSSETAIKRVEVKMAGRVTAREPIGAGKR